ncbi:MAG: arsenite methyltransferase [Planctomycetes bacterium]|nr:arsenite methyltransferase [Planctomycetota bacterium]MCP4861185.1 arsenite methyltransferase [Planctomycetota bacterium]
MTQSTPKGADQVREHVREHVSATYAEALKRTAVANETTATEDSGSCCKPKCCSNSPESTVAQLAGYDDVDQEGVADAARSSFGCGNPLAFSEVKEGQTVLDLGSGAGFDLLIAAGKVGESGKVIGVDMTDEMIEAARANAAKAGVEQVEVRKGVIEQLPVDDSSVDWVISNCVINLSTDKPAVFGEVARVLKPGGRFSVSDIVVEELPDILRQQAVAYSACIGGAISEADYITGLQQAGLEKVEVTERMVYTKEQIEGILTLDFGLDEASVQELRSALASVEGKVWSAKFVGQRA